MHYSITSLQSKTLVEHAINQANWVSHDVSFELQRVSLQEIEYFLKGKYRNLNWIIVDVDSEVIASTNRLSSVNPSGYPELESSKNGATGQGIRDIDGQLNIVVSLPVFFDGEIVAHLIIHYPADSIKDVGPNIVKFIVSTFIIALLLGIMLIYFSMRYQTKPLSLLIDDARSISDGDYDRVFTTSRTDEIAQLSRALQIMVTKLKSALHVAREEQSKFDAIFRNMMDGLIVADSDGRLLVANAAFLTMFGVSLAELYGFDVRQCDLPQEVVNSILFLEKEKEVVITKPSKRIIRIRTSPIDDSNEKIGSITICEDITRLKELESSEREFTQYISHELKTPLTSLSASVETLLDLPEEKKNIRTRFIKNLEKDIERLKKLVNSIITFQRTRDKAEDFGRFEAVELIMEVHSKFLAYAHKIGVHLNMVLPDDEMNVIANRDRITQVLMNLIDNALRFTPKGGEVNIGLSEEKNRVLFYVEDSGIGIPPQYLEKLGERFIKIPRKNHNYDTQVGLGLSICMEILGKHGSRLEISSIEGVGSKFSFYLKRS
ncbi:MAG: ATP-binding protein [Caldisericia bacterium]